MTEKSTNSKFLFETEAIRRIKTAFIITWQPVFISLDESQFLIFSKKGKNKNVVEKRIDLQGIVAVGVTELITITGKKNAFYIDHIPPDSSSNNNANKASSNNTICEVFCCNSSAMQKDWIMKLRMQIQQVKGKYLQIQQHQMQQQKQAQAEKEEHQEQEQLQKADEDEEKEENEQEQLQKAEEVLQVQHVEITESLEQETATTTSVVVSNDDNKLEFSVCSYNVNFGLCQIGTRDIEERSIVNGMKMANADVYCFQETTPSWQQYLANVPFLQSFKYKHYFHYKADNFGVTRPEAGGLAVYSKFEIANIQLIPSPVKWFPAHLYTIKIPISTAHSDSNSNESDEDTVNINENSNNNAKSNNNNSNFQVVPIAQQKNDNSTNDNTNNNASYKLVQILNVHLHPPLTENALPLPHAYFTSKYIDRIKECKEFVKHVDFSKPFIVCGDFNEAESEPSAQYFVHQLQMKSVLAKYAPNTTTWWWKLPTGITVTATFDHMFYSQLCCVSGNVNQIGVSDHYPIVGKFTLA